MNNKFKRFLTRLFYSICIITSLLLTKAAVNDKIEGFNYLIWILVGISLIALLYEIVLLLKKNQK